MLVSNMLSHQECEIKSLWISESVPTWTYLFVWAPVRLPGVVFMCDFCIGNVKQAARLLSCRSLSWPWPQVYLYIYYDRVPMSIQAPLPSLCILITLFSLPHRKSTVGRRLSIYLDVQSNHLWPRKLLGASCYSILTDKPFSLSDTVFLHEVMVIHHGSWWQYGSYQKNMKEGVS